MTPQWPFVELPRFIVVRLASRWSTGGGWRPSSALPQTHGGIPTTYAVSLLASTPVPYSAVLRQISSPVSRFHYDGESRNERESFKFEWKKIKGFCCRFWLPACANRAGLAWHVRMCAGGVGPVGPVDRWTSIAHKRRMR